MKVIMTLLNYCGLESLHHMFSVNDLEIGTTTRKSLAKVRMNSAYPTKYLADYTSLHIDVSM